MATISSLGIASGIDSNSIVSSLVALEKAPLTVLQTEATVDNAQITAFAQIQSEFSTLADAANVLGTTSTWQSLTSSSSNTSAATITTTTSATAGSYSLNIDKLAAAQTNASSSITSGSAVGAGNLTIQLGTWTQADSTTTPATAASFAAKTGTSSVSIAVTASDTVSTIATKINNANAGVTATTFNDGTGDRLILTGTNTGASNGFKITATDASGTALTDGTGLSCLAFNPTNASDSTSGAYGMAASTNPVTYSNDASARINGITVTSSSNTLTNNIPGVTINLLAATTTSSTSSGTTTSTNNPVTLSVTQDVASVVKNVETFVTAYNTLWSDLTSNTKYDSTTQTAALFQGDGSVVGLESLLSNMVSSISNGSTAYKRLSDVGIQVSTDGTLTIDTTKLSAAANNGTEMQKLFTTDNNDIATNGFGLKFSNFASGAVAAGGLVYTKSAALQQVLAKNTTDQQAVNDKASALQTRLQAQYSALDSKMATLNALATYVSQQVTTWNKSSS